MKKLIIILALLPFFLFASFPVTEMQTDTIRKNGKIYIKVDTNGEIDLNEQKEKQIRALEKKKIIEKNAKRKRVNKILGVTGTFFVIILVLVGIAALLLIRILYNAFRDFANSSG